MLEKNIEDRLKRCGEPQGGAALTAEQTAYAEEHLPLSFVGLLAKYGFGGVFDNGWQLCDQQKFRTLAAMIFKAGDLLPKAPSFITRVCRSGFHILRRRFASRNGSIHNPDRVRNRET